MLPKSKRANVDKNEMYYDKVNLDTNCPTFNKIINDNTLNFNDLPSLQNEVEQVLSQFGHTVRKISDVLSGKRYRSIKHKQNVSTNGSVDMSNGGSNQLDADEESLKELMVKETPNKPLTLVISQTRSDKKRTRSSLKYDEVNSLASSDNNSVVSKRRKSNDSNMDQPQPIEEFNGIKPPGKALPDKNPPQSSNNKLASNYEIPNKFWELMEPYCAEINEKNIKKLESMIESYNDDGHYYEAPFDRQVDDNSSLNGINGLSTNDGETSSSRRNSAHYEFDNNVKKHLNGFVDTKNGIDLSNLLKKIDVELSKSERPLSQQKGLQKFTSKIVQNLSSDTEIINIKSEPSVSIDTNGTKNDDHAMNIPGISITNEQLTQSPKNIAKQLRVNNGFKLDRHIKKSLDDLGVTSMEPKTQTNTHVSKLEESSLIKSQSSDPINGGIAQSLEAEIKDPVFISHADYVELSLPAVSTTAANSLTNDNSSTEIKLSNKLSNDMGNTDTKQSTSHSDITGQAKTKSPKQEPHTKIDMSARSDDQIVSCALERRQAELRLVSESNLGMLRRLLGIAKRDLKRQEIERKLAIADADVIEAYNVIESYRPTHRQPLKKDRDAASKALRERQKVLRELETFDSEFL